MKRILSLLLLITFSISQISATGKRVLFIGDSITDGAWGAADGRSSKDRSKTDFNHIYGHGFMADCASYFQSKYPERQYAFFNRGISGHTVYDLNNRWEEDAIAIEPDVISILIGINDIGKWMHDPKQPFDIDGWKAQYEQILDRSVKANPNVKFILCTPFTEKTGRSISSKDYETKRQCVEQCVKVVCELAKKYDASLLRYDLMFDELLQKETKDLAPEYWIWDGIHPTPAAHLRMAEMWIKAFKKLKIK